MLDCFAIAILLSGENLSVRETKTGTATSGSTMENSETNEPIKNKKNSFIIKMSRKLILTFVNNCFRIGLLYINMISRIPEKEIMDSVQNAIAYAGADFTEVNQSFVNRLVKEYSCYLKNVLDLGTGPGDIPIKLAKSIPNVSITAVDGSLEMIKIAKEKVQSKGLSNQIKLLEAYLPGLPLSPHSFDAIISNSLLHHLPNPIVLWEEVKLLAKRNSAVFIMDLLRPKSKEIAKNIVETYSKDEHPLLKEDFYNSLLAAFTLDEVNDQLKSSGLTTLSAKIISDRHLLISGIL